MTGWWFGAKFFLAPEKSFCLHYKITHFSGFCSMLRCHLKNRLTRFSKQVLLLEIYRLKNCKIELQSGTESVGNSVGFTKVFTWMV
jgi:hypothetical protein